MSFISARCPACGEEIEINPNNEVFFCPRCGAKTITQAAIAYNQWNSPESSSLDDAEPKSEQPPTAANNALELDKDTPRRANDTPIETSSISEESLENEIDKPIEIQDTDELSQKSYGSTFAVITACFAICTFAFGFFNWLVIDIWTWPNLLSGAAFLVVSGILGLMYRNNKPFNRFNNLKTTSCQAFAYASVWAFVISLIAFGVDFYLLWKAYALPDVVAYIHDQTVIAEQQGLLMKSIWGLRLYVLESFWLREGIDAVLSGSIALLPLSLPSLLVPYTGICILDWAWRKNSDR